MVVLWEFTFKRREGCKAVVYTKTACQKTEVDLWNLWAQKKPPECGVSLKRLCPGCAGNIKSPGRSRTAKEVRGGFPGMQKGQNIEEERRKQND